jgi:hypothetical protein
MERTSVYICVCAAGDIYANGRFIFARYSPLYFLCSLGKEKAKAKELQQLLFTCSPHAPRVNTHGMNSFCVCALRLCICVCRDEGTFSASEHTTKLCHFRRRFLLLLRTMRSERRESGEAFRLHADVLSFSLSAVARCLKVGE